MKFNEHLTILRKEKRFSQEELGNELGVARQTISKWELGETTPEMDKLIELSNLFEISLDKLVGNEKDYKKGLEKTDRKFGYEYQSKTKVMGIPLVHINVGIGRRKARGIIAIGNSAKGFLALGLLSIGIFSVGILGIGLFTIAAVSLGILLAVGGISVGTVAIGGLALGIFAIGGAAVGIYSIGGIALAKNIAYGGIASGHIAIGDHVQGTVKFVTQAGDPTFTSNEIKRTILKEFPHTWEGIVSIFSMLGI